MQFHPNDRQNRRKHAKMERRLLAGKVNPNCKWAKRRDERRAR